eukprot:m.182224 g.182224  ORF g.182224 m.182224 type:complete len:650 (-) comp21500_c0_seq2:105-2054(-)
MLQRLCRQPALSTALRSWPGTPRTLFICRRVTTMPAANSTGERLQQLRQLMQAGNLQGYVVPSEDAHQSEYLAVQDERRAFISGFTGSAGLAAVLVTEAALFTDGRYHLQAEQQLDENWTLVKSGTPGAPELHEYLCQKLKAGERVGVDASLYTNSAFRTLRGQLEQCSIGLVALDPAENLVDQVWAQHHRPQPSLQTIFPLEMKYAGESVQDKLARVRQSMEQQKCSCLVVSQLDEVAWLFNLRGADVPFNPVFFSFALVTTDRALLFVHQKHLHADCTAQLQGVEICDYSAFYTTLKEMAPALQESGRFWVGERCSRAVAQLLPAEKLHTTVSEITHAKAIKNAVELQGMRNCHARDAVALCRFFLWLEKKAAATEGMQLDETEASLCDVLEKFRSELHDFVSLSFPTISGMGANGAVIHYHCDPTSCKPIRKDGLYLCDSGGQYKDGTTDVTRTVHLGQPTRQEIDMFTAVLKGHIELGRVRFPQGTTGLSIDMLARQTLWERGLDYAHGTGHGVGSFLNVHEGPIGISQRPRSGAHPLKAGMIVTNEPGFYEDGKFGIRIENVIEVVSVQLEHNFKNKGFLGFENVTVFPIQAKLIDVAQLTDGQLAWLNAYHNLVRERVAPLLQQQGLQEELQWLIDNTRELSR